MNSFKFVALQYWQDTGYLEKLNAKQGQCDDLEVNEDCRHCGRTRALISMPGDNEVIRDDDLDYSVWSDTQYTNKAQKYCASIVGINCDQYCLSSYFLCNLYPNLAKRIEVLK